LKEEQIKDEQAYWSNRYLEASTAWDIGAASRPLLSYFEQLDDKAVAILIPGAGNAYEAAYLHQQGFNNVHILDISDIPLKQFADLNPDFPKAHIHHQDFFKHKGKYNLIIEQTFFCSLIPTGMNRVKYATKIASLLVPKGQLVGLWFNHPLTDDMEKRPFGGSQKEYEGYLSPYFDVTSFEPCHNSIDERQGDELFGIFQKKEGKKTQPKNPLHGITLKMMLEQLVATYNWSGLSQMVRIRCFIENPSMNSSLTFLRQTPWAREKIEGLYLKTLRKGLLKD